MEKIITFGTLIALSLALVSCVFVGVAYGDHVVGGGSNCCAFINITGDSGGIEGGNWALINL